MNALANNTEIVNFYKANLLEDVERGITLESSLEKYQNILDSNLKENKLSCSTWITWKFLLSDAYVALKTSK